jgi:serine/threonine protein kinase
MDDLQRVQLYREINIHAAVSHPNVITLYAAFKVGESTP